MLGGGEFCEETKRLSTLDFIHRLGGCNIHTAKTRIIEPCAMSLELPPLVRSDIFLFFYCPQRG